MQDPCSTFIESFKKPCELPCELHAVYGKALCLLDAEVFEMCPIGKLEAYPTYAATVLTLGVGMAMKLLKRAVEQSPDEEQGDRQEGTSERYTCANRARPYGDEHWTKGDVEQRGILLTLRPVGRPLEKRSPVT